MVWKEKGKTQNVSWIFKKNSVMQSKVCFIETKGKEIKTKEK